MNNDKRTDRLNAEELEDRAAPMTIMDQLPEETDPNPSSPSGPGNPSPPDPADQPGNSDGHRQNPWHKAE